MKEYLGKANTAQCLKWEFTITMCDFLNTWLTFQNRAVRNTLPVTSILMFVGARHLGLTEQPLPLQLPLQRQGNQP